MAYRILIALVAASCATTSYGYAKIAGYVPTSDVADASAVGALIEAVDAALSKDPRDWTLAKTEYEKNTAGGLSLRGILDAPAAKGDQPFKDFAAYYGANDYMHEFVLPALQGSGTFALSDKARSELTMKGIVLQGVLMASMSDLHKAATLCSQGKVGNADGAPHLVDHAWALYASSETKGPIKLAEKRAPQFATEATPFTEAGSSQVNTRLLDLFKKLQIAAQQGNCTGMTTLVGMSIAQMQVPVIQGMLREAYEVDPKEKETHKGADGFVEVVEGWAFARAVLPAIAKCSAPAAKYIKENMDTIALGEKGPHLTGGYVKLKAAVESTYSCLGISCADVNAMTNPFKTGQLLWQPCIDGAVPAFTAPPIGWFAPNTEVSAAQRGAPLLFLTASVALLMRIA